MPKIQHFSHQLIKISPRAVLITFAFWCLSVSGKQGIAEVSLLDELKNAVEQAKDDSAKCAALHKLGRHQFFELRMLPEAAKSLYGALEIAELNQLERLKAECNAALGWIENRKGNDYEAFTLMEKACNLFVNEQDEHAVFRAYYNLGVMAEEINDFELAKEKLEQAATFARTVERQDWLLNSLNALGILYLGEENYATAISSLLESANLMYEKQGNYGNGRIPTQVSRAYTGLGNLAEARRWMDLAIGCAQREDDALFFKEVYFADFELLQLQGKIDAAFERYKQYSLYKDSLFNTNALLMAKQAEESYLQKLDSARQEEILLKEKLDSANLKKKESERNVLVLILILAVAVGTSALLIVRMRKKATEKRLQLVTENQEQLTAAYDELEEANQEIVDSINCAKRIQSAILPPDELIKAALPDSFVLYRPKAIVAGDFYWLEQAENKTLFAVCDCTGHGVPGALVSIICNNALNQAVREYKLIDPGQLLTKVREIVSAEFEKSTEDVKDGMDIALCALEGNVLRYAGAINPLWIVRNGSSEIEEIKGSRQPIGKIDKPVEYPTHEVELNEGDSLYIFSDGFADQFGGASGKKFKIPNLKKLILSLQNESIADQKKLAERAFEEWRGNLEQIDDVCMIGVRFRN